MPKHHFDVIVLGVGSMGAAACYYLAKKGNRVLGLEQFDIPHDRGSHGGQSRIIRKAYFEHPDYVPLLEKAYRNWSEIEREAGTTLYHRTGLLYAGQPHSPLISGTKQSALKYQISLEQIAGQSRQRFSQFHIPDNFEMLFEPEAGFITPERAVLTFAQGALRNGAVLYPRQRALHWTLQPTGIEVQTDSAVFTCDSLVITAGAWASQLLPALQRHVTVTRQVVAWFQPRSGQQFDFGNMPCWLIAPPELPGAFYGFPSLPVQHFGGPLGLKVAYHYPGTVSDPDRVNATNTQDDEAQLAAAAERYLPGSRAYTLSIKTCLYTNTPDEHFIVDFLPDTQQRVVVAAGFSGHGFKFVAGLGETLADMAAHQKTNDPIEFLSLRRLGYSHR